MPQYSHEPIAMVGSACRFAGGASSPSKLWDILQAPIDLQKEIPTNRFNTNGFYHENGSYHGHTNVRHAYLLDEDLAVFDAEFFNIKPVEAKAMDPQQRFLLEIVYEALESSGMPIASLRGSDTGVYVGVMFNDYAALLLRDFQSLPTYFATGTGQSVLSNRISWFYDWHGPSVTVDTACSSSLVAVHMAVQALRSGDCRMALACGTNLIIGPESFIIESKLNMLSPSGRSRMWDQKADGYARGEGVATLVLKTLRAAIEDGDNIECIIRETGLNQDGATPGITVPNAAAQEALIRSTYAKAGLDLSKARDRPQYVEAHGTGTPAGDPEEAEALHNTFSARLKDDKNNLHVKSTGKSSTIYVGSIKTVFGHTEGAAGVAALMKASLALQQHKIPPNLLFDKLNPRILPFYRNFEIATSLTPWPAIESDQPRRASVNSFGFGGTNAHVILESYQGAKGLTFPSPGGYYDRTFQTRDLSSPQYCLSCSSRGQTFTPFIFSAHCDKSLRAILSKYVDFFRGSGGNISPCDLAWTLRKRRSTLRYRIHFPASSILDLRNNIESILKETQRQATRSPIGVKISNTSPAHQNGTTRILGIFTGQGAQYARMGASLLEHSPMAKMRMQELQSYLDHLPNTTCRPPWSLDTELLADPSTSRVNLSDLSQPLCTALQILMVDLLRVAGVDFSAVIGHSSGEIAAAYAAGYLSARDAMLIAYFRGLHSSLASSPNDQGIRGAMLAVDASSEDMEDLCSDERFAGRVGIAAINSSSNVTISGDEEAIAELTYVLDDEQKFYRRLRVDKAYHSSHMDPCVNPYIASLRRLDISPTTPSPPGRCVWFSSVDAGQPIDYPNNKERLKDRYWAENLRQPVLFYQAVSAALRDESYDAVLEIGPHPALQTPTQLSIREAMKDDVPYKYVLKRGEDAIGSSSTTLGFLWSLLGDTKIDLDRYERSMAGIGNEKQHHFQLVKSLPSYSWKHDVQHWHESRRSRKMRSRGEPVHPLLGDATPDSAPHHLRWRNLLRIEEMEWLTGHAVQGQIVFPAAGYIATALEAAFFLAPRDSVCLLEIVNFTIYRAVPFDQDDAGIEVLIELTDIDTNRSANMDITAKFKYNASVDAQNNDISLIASADMIIHLGEPSESLLPRRGSPLPYTIEVEPTRFYNALRDLGYNFEGRFCALSSMQRKRGKASCLVTLPPSDHSLLIHPVELDALFQSVFLAHSYPYDEELRALHLPTAIHRIRVNPASLRAGSATRGGKAGLAPIDCSIRPKNNAEYTDGIIVADVNFFDTACSIDTQPPASIQIQGITLSPLGGPPEPDQDRRVYSKEYWVPTTPDGTEAARGLWDDEDMRNKARLLERIATFYLRKFDREVPSDHPARVTSPTKWYLRYARYISNMVETREHMWWQPEWEQDGIQSILDISEPHMGLPDFQIMHLVGLEMPRVFEGDTTMLEQFRNGDLLDKFYSDGIITNNLAPWVARAVKQITTRYPHMNILEVGAGTGGATKAIFNEIGDNFHTYTYTDISVGFFEMASMVFSSYKHKMLFKSLDVERDPTQQGFVEGSYDLVIAFFVIHATSDLAGSLRNLRKLLKPGGFLAMGEGTDYGNGTASSGFVFGTLPGWWVGANNGRELTPFLPASEWDLLLRSTGFSGADTTRDFSSDDVFNVFPVVTQALDARISHLREPLVDWSGIDPIRKLVVVGGQGSRTADLAVDLQEAIVSRGLAREVHHFRCFTDTGLDLIDQNSVVVSLTDLDSPVFMDITAERFHVVKKILSTPKTIVWVTSGRRDDEPFANMIAAFARCAVNEVPGLNLQLVDIPARLCYTNSIDLARIILSFHAALSMKFDGGHGGNSLWTNEREILLDREGRQYVPRLRLVSELNERYNAGYRPVVHQRELRESPLPVRLQLESRWDSSNYFLRDVPRYEAELWEHDHGMRGRVHIRTVCSTLAAVVTRHGHRFLVLGLDPKTTQAYCYRPTTPQVETRAWCVG
ncbi:hypothetical protein F4777DRAFT_573085 [Nemania sp. FL0916]|nr:hypothetical protein F4777DRAFT_573085 [Nemania sp. FL0916]